jgi:hypothetical protein
VMFEGAVDLVLSGCRCFAEHVRLCNVTCAVS